MTVLAFMIGSAMGFTRENWCPPTLHSHYSIYIEVWTLTERTPDGKCRYTAPPKRRTND